MQHRKDRHEVAPDQAVREMAFRGNAVSDSALAGCFPLGRCHVQGNIQPNAGSPTKETTLMRLVFVNAYWRVWNGHVQMVKAHWRKWPKSRNAAATKRHATL